MAGSILFKTNEGSMLQSRPGPNSQNPIRAGQITESSRESDLSKAEKHRKLARNTKVYAFAHVQSASYSFKSADFFQFNNLHNSL